MTNDLRRLNNWRKHPQVHSLLQPWYIHGKLKGLSSVNGRTQSLN